MMTAALGTLPFLATLWLLVVLGAKALEESGAKVAAALKGRPARHPQVIAPMRLRIRAARPTAMHAAPPRRVAA
jgi:hypothetical protein